MTRRPHNVDSRLQPAVDSVRRELDRDRGSIARCRADKGSGNVSARVGEIVSVRDGATVTLPRATTEAIGSIVGVVGHATIRTSDAGDLVGGRSKAYSASNRAMLLVAAAAGRWEPITFSSSTVKDFGAAGDGVTDDTEAIQRALDAVSEYGGSIEFTDGVYLVSAALTATLAATSGVKTILHGAGIIKASSSFVLDTTLLQITAAERDLVVGGITFDGNSRSHRLLNVEQASTASNEITFDGITVKNCWAEAATSSIALFCRGGYEHVRLINSKVYNVSRKQGITGGATIGASITVDAGATHYPRRTSVANCHFESVLNNEAYSSADNLDTDGLSMLGSLLTGRDYQDAQASVVNCHFKNCKGRGIKIQHDSVTIGNCNFYRNVVGLITSGFGEIDFQATRGTVSDCNFHYEPSGASEETLDNAGSIISVRNSFTTRNRFYSISNCHAYGTCTRGYINTFLEASTGTTPVGAQNVNNLALHVTGCTIDLQTKAFVNVSGYPSSSWPARGRVSLVGCSARGLLHGVVSCSSGSTKGELTHVSIVDFNNFAPAPIQLYISSATAANPVVVTTNAAHGLSNGEVVGIAGCNQHQLNGRTFTVANKTSNTFELSGEDGTGRTAGTAGLVNGKGTIANATQADPVVITTAAAHGLADGDVVYIRNVAGMTEINNKGYVINVLTATTFELNDEDGTGYTAYSSGGELSPRIKATFVTGAPATEAIVECRIANAYGVETYGSSQANAGAHSFALKGNNTLGSTEVGSGGVKCFSFAMYDDETVEVPQAIVGNSMFFALHTTYGTGTCGMFYMTTSAGVTAFPGHTLGADLSLDNVSGGGTPGTNPDVDDDLNLWVDTTTSKLKIKNRLGSTRTITVVMYGA